jgi:hypothetical protein
VQFVVPVDQPEQSSWSSHTVSLVMDPHGVSVPVQFVVPVDQPEQSSCSSHTVSLVMDAHGVIVPLQVEFVAFQLHPAVSMQSVM